MNTISQTFNIWMQNTPDSVYGGPWRKTRHSIEAEDSKQAQDEMRKQFAPMKLTACRLVALPENQDPNGTLK